MTNAKTAQDLIDNPKDLTEENATAEDIQKINDGFNMLTNSKGSQTQDNPNLKTVELDDPIKRGNGAIESVDVRKPSAGELRGVSLMDVAQMDVLALRKVLPRITNPSLTDAEIGQLSLADMMQFGVIVSAFLLTKRQKADSGYLDA